MTLYISLSLFKTMLNTTPRDEQAMNHVVLFCSGDFYLQDQELQTVNIQPWNFCYTVDFIFIFFGRNVYFWPYHFSAQNAQWCGHFVGRRDRQTRWLSTYHIIVPPISEQRTTVLIVIDFRNTHLFDVSLLFHKKGSFTLTFVSNFLIFHTFSNMSMINYRVDDPIRSCKHLPYIPNLWTESPVLAFLIDSFF